MREVGNQLGGSDHRPAYLAEWLPSGLECACERFNCGQFLSLENLNVIIRAITNWSNLVALNWGGATRFLGLVSVWATITIKRH